MSEITVPSGHSEPHLMTGTCVCGCGQCVQAGVCVCPDCTYPRHDKDDES